VESRTVAVSTQVRVDQPCLVEYIVEWQGERDACVVLPLDLPQPEWGKAELKASRTERDGERWRVTQVVAYTAEKPGKYAVAPVEVEVITSNQPIVGVFEKTPGTRVKMEGTSITVSTAPSALVWSGVAVVAAVVLGALLLPLKRRRKGGVSGQEEDVVGVSHELVHAARRCRLDGDYYACYQSLLRAAEALQTVNIDAKAVADGIRARIPAVGFQGVRPTDDELDGLFRDIERIIARRNSPPVSEQETQSCR
jgi:hypothetical protein